MKDNKESVLIAVLLILCIQKMITTRLDHYNLYLEPELIQNKAQFSLHHLNKKQGPLKI